MIAVRLGEALAEPPVPRATIATRQGKKKKRRRERRSGRRTLMREHEIRWGEEFTCVAVASLPGCSQTHSDSTIEDSYFIRRKEIFLICVFFSQTTNSFPACSFNAAVQEFAGHFCSLIYTRMLSEHCQCTETSQGVVVDRLWDGYDRQSSKRPTVKVCHTWNPLNDF